MRIDDFVCLGRTVPEDSKKYGVKVCCAGYSEELRSFLRVYPLPVSNPLQQRSRCELEVERPTCDSRNESWRLSREREDRGFVDVESKQPTTKVVQWLDAHLSCSIAELNAQRRSLGVIKPASCQPCFRNRGEVADPDQQSLFGDIAEIFGEEAAKFVPYIRFTDNDGTHNLQLREWGCHEWLRKEPSKRNQLWDNLRLHDPKSDVYLVVGNMCHRRNTWLIISVYRAKREATLFDSLASPALA